MVEALAVASGKGGTGKTTATLALGMALADDYDVTVVDTDTGMANLLFHAGLADVDVTLHDLLVSNRDAALADATYDRFGMRIVPCGTSLEAFRAAEPAGLRDVIADLAADTDLLLLDSPATLASRGAVLPIALADRIVLVVQPTIPAITDALKVQEYAGTYGTGVAGVLFNKVHEPAAVDRVVERAGQYFEGPIVGTVPADDAAREARRAGKPLLAHAPDSDAARSYRDAASSIDLRLGAAGAFADRFRQAVIPDPP
ncbi:MAG: AAA family ATPase [Halanaeroarchaeum sp.]